MVSMFLLLLVGIKKMAKCWVKHIIALHVRVKTSIFIRCYNLKETVSREFKPHLASLNPSRPLSQAQLCRCHHRARFMAKKVLKGILRYICIWGTKPRLELKKSSYKRIQYRFYSALSMTLQSKKFELLILLYLNGTIRGPGWVNLARKKLTGYKSPDLL